MKNTIIKFVFAAISLLFCGAALAQQETGTKAKAPELAKQAEQVKPEFIPPVPQVINEPLMQTITEQPKPVLPAAEIKPAETAMPASKARASAEEKFVPVIPPPPVNDARPAVKETNAGKISKPAAVPVQQVIKEQ